MKRKLKVFMKWHFNPPPASQTGYPLSVRSLDRRLCQSLQHNTGLKFLLGQGNNITNNYIYFRVLEPIWIGHLDEFECPVTINEKIKHQNETSIVIFFFVSTMTGQKQPHPADFSSDDRQKYAGKLTHCDSCWSKLAVHIIIFFLNEC